MGRLLSLMRGVECSIRSRLGQWMQEVSTTTDQAVVDIAALQAAQSREDWKDSVAVAITSALPAFTQDGNTITFDAVGALPAQDGVAIVTQTPPQRALLAIGTNVYNGIWDVIDSGGATAAVLQRSSDADTSAEVTSAMRVPIAEGGTAHGGRVFRLGTNDLITLNVTALTYVEEQGLEDGTAVGQLATWDGSGWGAAQWPLNAQTFGAVGNGVVDDYAAIQAAINAIPSRGGRVYLPAGTYRVTQTLALDGANRPVELFGDGSGEQIHGTPAGGGSVVVWGGAAPAPVIEITGNAKAVRHLAVDNAVAGANAATHGIRAVSGASGNLRIEDVVMFPDPAVSTGFTTAAIEIGGVGGDPLVGAHLNNVYLRNSTVGLLTKQTISTKLDMCRFIECTTGVQLGTATTTSIATQFYGCVFEARAGDTDVSIVRAQSVLFSGCQIDAYGPQRGVDILSAAVLADLIEFQSCRFIGLNAAAYGMKVDFASATVTCTSCLFTGFATAGINNANNKLLTIVGSHDDESDPIVDSLTNGSVRMLGNDIASVGPSVDLIGGALGVRIAGYAEFGGTLPTTGLFRFPKPSEQGTLAVFRREASAVDVPFIRVDVTSSVRIGETDVGVMPTLFLEANTDMYFRVPTIYLREVGGTIRHTITNAAASVWATAAATSLAFNYDATERFKIDVTGLSFYGVATTARQLLATGAGHTVDDVITALQTLGLVRQV